MKKKSTSKSAFFNLRVLIASVLCLFGVFVALLGSGVFAQTKAPGPLNNLLGPMRRRTLPAHRGRTSCQWSVRSCLNTDLRNLPYVAPKAEFEERVLTRYPHGTGSRSATQDRLLRQGSEAAQKYLAPDAHNAGADADL